MATMAANVLDPPEELLAAGPFDLVIAADVLYEPRLPPAFAALLPELVAAEGEAVIAYPFAGQAAPLVAPLRAAGWAAEETQAEAPGWREGQSPINLLRLRPPPAERA
jgi:hypothetical protein